MLNVFEMSVTGSWPKDRPFRRFMVNFASQFTKDDLQHLKYVLQKNVPAGTLANLETTLDLFKELERRGMIGPGNLYALRSVLEDLGKLRLCFMIDEFDDSCSVRYPPIAKSENFLEMDGYRLAVKGGRHFETSEGEFVEVPSRANYGLTITNLNPYRCDVRIKIDGYIFRNNFVLNPKQEVTIERPCRETKKFKFYAIADAPSGSGINEWKTYQNGVVELVFTPERADMKIACVAQGTATQVLTCSDQTTDSEFYEMVLASFGATNATIMINWWQPLSKRGVELSEYGITNGSRVTVNFGGRGGGRSNFNALPSIRKTIAPKKNDKWRAGATALNDESEQTFFCYEKCLPVDPVLAVSLTLRLVARADEKPLPSTGECVPLAGRATLIPPPVPNYS